jgi:hypothetical protein
VHRLLVVPVAVLGLAGCGADVASAARVAQQAADALEQQVGVRPVVTCPEDVALEVGATTRCTLTAPGDTTEYGLTVTVTAVDGDEATVDVQVDDEPLG